MIRLSSMWRRLAAFSLRTLWRCATNSVGRARYRRAVKLLNRYGLMPIDLDDLRAAYMAARVLDKYSYANRGVRQFSHARRLIVQTRGAVQNMVSDPTPEVFK